MIEEQQDKWTPTVRRLVGAAKSDPLRPEDEGLVQALLRGAANPTGVAQFLLRDDEDGPGRLWWVARELYRRGFVEGDPGEQTRSIEAVRDIVGEYVRHRPDLATRQLLELLSSDALTPELRVFPRELYDQARELTKDVKIDHDAPIEGVTDLEDPAP
jgi:hypothetical protein